MECKERRRGTNSREEVGGIACKERKSPRVARPRRKCRRDMAEKGAQARAPRRAGRPGGQGRRQGALGTARAPFASASGKGVPTVGVHFSDPKEQRRLTACTSARRLGYLGGGPCQGVSVWLGWEWAVGGCAAWCLCLRKYGSRSLPLSKRARGSSSTPSHTNKSVRRPVGREARRGKAVEVGGWRHPLPMATLRRCHILRFPCTSVRLVRSLSSLSSLNVRVEVKQDLASVRLSPFSPLPSPPHHRAYSDVYRCRRTSLIRTARSLDLVADAGCAMA